TVTEAPRSTRTTSGPVRYSRSSSSLTSSASDMGAGFVVAGSVVAGDACPRQHVGGLFEKEVAPTPAINRLDRSPVGRRLSGRRAESTHTAGRRPGAAHRRGGPE